MSSLQCRGSLARASFMVAMLASMVADTQAVAQGPAPKRGVWMDDWLHVLETGYIGYKYDIVNQALAEKHVQKLQAKLARDTEGGDKAAADRDAYRINNLKYRIVVDEWLIRKNCLMDPGPYPRALRLDHITCAAIADAARPAQESRIPQYVQGTMPMPAQTPGYPTATSTPGQASAKTITIINAQPAGAGISFSIDGIPKQVAGGSRVELPVLPDSNLAYDGGGSIGPREYRASPGETYEFRATAEGLAIYKLADKP
jgi:hypothetical protein